MYMLIENPGVAPVEAYTILGMSTSRTSNKSGTIGQFGSGSKHAINTLLRSGNDLVVFCGDTELRFGTKIKPIRDATDTWTNIEVVICTVIKAPFDEETVELGFSKDFGAMDWDDIGMALREFVSNAIDCTIARGLNVDDSINSGDLRVTMVDPSQVHGSQGMTRVFVKASPSVFDYYGNLGRHFLHFNQGQWAGRIQGQVTDTIMKKDDPTPVDDSNNNKPSNEQLPHIYREGVFVRRIGGQPSLFNYNFKREEIKIDESRNSNDSIVRSAVANVLRGLPAEELAIVIRKVSEYPDTFEGNLSTWDLGNCYGISSDEKKVWMDAWLLAFGNKAVAVNKDSIQIDSVAAAKAKGYTVQILPNCWYGALQNHGCPTLISVLTKLEREGMREEPATTAALAALDWVWNILEYAGMTADKEKPTLKCFTAVGNANSTMHGLCTTEGIFVSSDLADNDNNYLKQVILEEVVHWVTGSHDGSRDMQNYVIKLFVSMMQSLGTPTR